MNASQITIGTVLKMGAGRHTVFATVARIVRHGFYAVTASGEELFVAQSVIGNPHYQVVK